MKVLKIGAKWCPGCKIMTPRWQEIEKENPWLKTEYIGVDEHPEMINKYHITNMPAFLFLDKEEKEITRFSGEVEKEILVKCILENKDK
ncbi:thioredoxin family protein [Candidatus Parcubacteria bacterium]|nr:thioredoxin family protein [Candidatus Parcubacteria bacterium]